MSIDDRPTIVGPAFRVVLDADATVLWLVGDHDIATRRAIRRHLADLIALDDRDLVVDLSMTTFLGAGEIGELEGARHHLLACARRLTVRGPSAFIARTLALCNAGELLGPRPVASQRPRRRLSPLVGRSGVAPRRRTA